MTDIDPNTARDVLGRVRVVACTFCSHAHGIPLDAALFPADRPLPCEGLCGTSVRNVWRVRPETRDAFLASVASGRVGTWKREPAPAGKPFAANGGDIDTRTGRTATQLFAHRCEDGLATTDPETGETRCGACEETDMSPFLASICPDCANKPIPIFSPVEGRTSETNVCRVCGKRRLCQRFSVTERFLAERRKALGFGDNKGDHLVETDHVSAYPEALRVPSPFVRVAFATDPRVIERAKRVFDSRLAAARDENEHLTLFRESVDQLLESARARPDSPEGVWLREAEALATRLGRAWDQAPEGRDSSRGQGAWTGSPHPMDVYRAFSRWAKLEANASRGQGSTLSRVEALEASKDKIQDFLLAQVPSILDAILNDSENRSTRLRRETTAPSPGLGLGPHVAALLREIAGTRGLVPLGFPTTVLAAASVACMEMSPQLPIRGRLLVLSSSDASLDGLLLKGIRVGHTAIEGTSFPIPAAVFGPRRAFPLPLAFWAIDIYQTVRLHLENTTARQMTVNGVLLGEPIR